MAWIPNNINAPSANKDRGDDNVFKYRKKGKKKTGTLAQAIKGFNEIKKIK